MKAVQGATQRAFRNIRCLQTSSALSNMDISGIYPPITTPFDNEENIDWTAMKSNMEKWNQIPFRGYVVQGSNVEYAFMTMSERLELVSV